MVNRVAEMQSAGSQHQQYFYNSFFNIIIGSRYSVAISFQSNNNNDFKKIPINNDTTE